LAWQITKFFYVVINRVHHLSAGVDVSLHGGCVASNKGAWIKIAIAISLRANLRSRELID